MLTGLADLGGAVLDLEGGVYNISRPLEIGEVSHVLLAARRR